MPAYTVQLVVLAALCGASLAPRPAAANAPDPNRPTTRVKTVSRNIDARANFPANANTYTGDCYPAAAGAPCTDCQKPCDAIIASIDGSDYGPYSGDSDPGVSSLSIIVEMENRNAPECNNTGGPVLKEFATSDCDKYEYRDVTRYRACAAVSGRGISTISKNLKRSKVKLSATLEDCCLPRCGTYRPPACNPDNPLLGQIVTVDAVSRCAEPLKEVTRFNDERLDSNVRYKSRYTGCLNEDVGNITVGDYDTGSFYRLNIFRMRERTVTKPKK